MGLVCPPGDDPQVYIINNGLRCRGRSAGNGILRHFPGSHHSKRFRWVKAPTSGELTQLTHTIAQRIARYLERQGWLVRYDGCVRAPSGGVITALESAIQLGHRNPQFFDDPIFKDLRDEPGFIALQQELDAILAVEHEKVLRLICFNNPTPDNWQPLPETCEGVVNQQN